jgi:hypothetical protein
MIVRERDGELILVRQTDHDDQCGRMAAMLDSALLPSAAAHRALTRAAFLHDNGWRDWEEHPTLDPKTAQPRSFTQLDPATWCALYSGGIAVAVDADPLTGLLVSMHGLGLRRRFLGIHGAQAWRTPPDDEDPEIERFAQEQELLQIELIEGLRASPATAEIVAGCVLPKSDEIAVARPLVYGPALLRLYKLLEFLDQLSLRLNWRGLSEEPFQVVPAPDATQPDRVLAARKVDPHTLALAPYPFSHSPLAVPVVARILPKRPFESDDDFRDAYIAAEPRLIPYTLVAD